MDKDSRNKLIKAATQLFAQKDFNNVSIRELAKAAQVNSALISYHFGGKEGLYKAVLEEQFSYMLTNLNRIRKAPLSPRKRLEKFMGKVMEIHRNFPFLLPLVYKEITNPTICFNEIITSSIQQVAGFLQEVLREGQGEKEFREDLEPAHASLILAGMLNFYFIAQSMVNKIIPASANRDKEYLEQILNIYFQGIERR